MVDVNIKGVLWGIVAVLPTMNEQGSGRCCQSNANRSLHDAGRSLNVAV
jgi:NADP-dependent 3-hydroxy acid dehydrogenase YdfG